MLLTSLNGLSTIKVHFWNLERYVAGHLVGGWIDLDECEDFDHFKFEVYAVTRDAEEFILGDYESEFGINFREYQSLESIWDIHTKLLDISEDSREAFGDYLAYHGGVDYLDTAIGEFEDRYCGQWNSIDDYALDFAADVYSEFFKDVPPGFRVEVDTVAWECDHWISDNGHVFRCF
ncbi:antirestriction protein ArdA [Nonomuraea jabiensis]|uniref:antirestriction protein ArdA n=1 Tax=Nonomuraea jabiensis TaxID=882448 RepID=UPI003D7363CB